MKMKILSLVLVTILTVGCKSNKEKKSENNQHPNEPTAASDTSITNKYWKLIKLDGQEVTMAKNQERERYFSLKADKNRIQGFSGCNSFSGEFTLEKEKKRIRFSQLASTMKACPDVDVDESAFLKIFDLTDNYTINNDTLSLNVGRRAPLAVFKAVYFD